MEMPGEQCGIKPAWLTPWDATSPMGSVDVPPTFAAMARSLRAEARAGKPAVGDYVPRSSNRPTDGWWNRLWLAAQRMLATGWISNSPGTDRTDRPSLWAPTTASLAWDCTEWRSTCGPKNAASRRVVETRLPIWGIRERYLHIDGAWRDHLTFAITSEEVPGGLLQRFLATRIPGTTASHTSQSMSPLSNLADNS